MKIRSVVIASVCGASLSLSGVAQAQQDQPKTGRPQQPGVQVNVGRHGDGQISEISLATCLAIENQEEIAISKFAAEKAHNSKVKEFASMIGKEHQTFLQKLQKYAPEATKEGYFQESADPHSAVSDAARDKADVKVGAAGAAVKSNTAKRDEQAAVREDREKAEHKDGDANRAGHTDHTSMLQLHREFAQQCLNDAKQNLSKKDGAAFDECFMGMQIAKHAGMKAKLTVIERHVSGDLKEIVSEGLKTTEKHLQKAEEIMKQLDHNSTTASTK